MNIARILYPVKVLGPGKRIGIWVCGCRRRCPGCSNPELWERHLKYEISLPNLKKLIGDIVSDKVIDGFTITGGEPMEQEEELSDLVAYLQSISADILVYTGYAYADLRKAKSEHIDRVLGSIAVLIDEEYIEERNNNITLRGSNNQQIIVLNPAYKDCYDSYLKTAHNQVQNFTTTDGVVSVGIHKKDFANQISKRVFENEGGPQNG